ncbi:serine/threonine protein phosphatase [Mycolicibacterium litorale]|nr:serine/threonine protein phosphatase [Mycolicibacterium litorale]
MSDSGRPEWIRAATPLFGWIVLAYLAGAVLSWQAFGAGIGAAFFPSAGVTVAAMLLTRKSLWPPIVAAIVVVELAVDLRYGTSLARAAGFAVANSVEPLVGASLVRAWCKGPPDLRRRPDLARFVAGAVVLGPLAGGLIGGLLSAVDGHSRWPSAVLHWWAGDGVGVLVIGAPILLWPLQSHIVRRRWPETALVLLGTAVLSLSAFWFGIPPALLLLPVMAWAALRLDMIGACLSGAVLAFTANVMTDAGRGTFADLPMATPGRLAITQAFIAVVVLVAMLTAQEAAGRVTAVRQREAEQRERARLETLANLGQLLSGAFTQSQIGDAVVGQVINDAGAQALTVGLVTTDGTGLDWVTMGGYPDSVVDRFAGGLEITAPTAATEAVRTGQPVVVRTLAEYRRRYPDNARWMVASGSASLVSWPLTAGGDAIGVLVLSWREPQPLDTAQLAYTSAVATMIGQALVRARVYADEHARAAVLQAAVLPSSPAPIEGVDVAVSYEPADVVQGLGGDWYDALALPHGRMYFAVGDVVGHGLPAVEDMAQLRSAGRALALQGLSPAQLLVELNTFTRYASNGKFATMGVAVLDPAEGILAYASAGHPPPLLRRCAGGGVIRLSGAHGPVLGPLDDAFYTQGHIEIHDGDIVVMYTDGLVERRGQDIETGLERAQGLVGQWSGEESLPAACRQLTQVLAPTPRNDDVCVVAVRFRLTGAPHSPTPASKP